MVPTLIAHTILNADEHFKNNAAYINWKANSFKKVTLRVNQKEWAKILNLPVYLGHENTTLGGQKSCAVVLPGTEANVLKFGKMWSPKCA